MPEGVVAATVRAMSGSVAAIDVSRTVGWLPWTSKRYLIGWPPVWPEWPSMIPADGSGLRPSTVRVPILRQYVEFREER